MEALQEPKKSGDEEKGERSFKESLVRARDQRAHFSKLDTKPLKQAIKRLAGTEDEPGHGSLLMGENFKDFYPEFSTQLDYQLFIPHTKQETVPLKKFAGQLSGVVVNLICFAVWSLQSYFAKYSPPSTKQREFPPRSVPFPAETND